MRVAIVLGNRMNDDGSLSAECIRRLELLLALDENMQFNRVILSGGIANKKAGISEAAAMQAELLKRGMDSDIILIEDKSRTTKKNARYSVGMLSELKPDETFVISSSAHIGRAYFNPIKLFKREVKNTGVETKLFFFAGF